MDFSFARVETALAQVHWIRDDARSAFAARLKHLQRLGFPEGINTGRGKAATYSIGHLMQLGLALELIQLGIQPERAKDHVVDALYDYARTLHLMLLKKNTEEANPQFAVAFWPSAMLPLMRADAARIEALLMFSSLDHLALNLDPAAEIQFSRFCYSNLTSMYDGLRTAVIKQCRIQPEDFDKAVSDWTLTIMAEGGDRGSNPKA